MSSPTSRGRLPPAAAPPFACLRDRIRIFVGSVVITWPAARVSAGQQVRLSDSNSTGLVVLIVSRDARGGAVHRGGKYLGGETFYRGIIEREPADSSQHRPVAATTSWQRVCAPAESLARRVSVPSVREKEGCASEDSRPPSCTSAILGRPGGPVIPRGGGASRSWPSRVKPSHPGRGARSSQST